MSAFSRIVYCAFFLNFGRAFCCNLSYLFLIEQLSNSCPVVSCRLSCFMVNCCILFVIWSILLLGCCYHSHHHFCVFITWGLRWSILIEVFQWFVCSAGGDMIGFQTTHNGQYDGYHDMAYQQQGIGYASHMQLCSSAGNSIVTSMICIIEFCVLFCDKTVVIFQAAICLIVVVLLRARASIISYGNSICPMSVCPSWPGTDSSPGEIETSGFHHMIA